MCQKAYGNPSAIFVAFEKGYLEFVSGSPKFYKSSDIDFAEKARESAEKLQHQMDILLSEKGI